MKRIFIMDDSGIKEYVPADFLLKNNAIPIENPTKDEPTEDKLLTIADLVKNFR